MSNTKSVNVPLASHFMLSKDQSPKTEITEMKNVLYSNVIGSVMYLIISTRSDITYTVSCLSRFMSNPNMPHWNALKWLLRYLKNTIDIDLTFSKCSIGTKLVGYVDSNYTNNRDNRKSTTSYVFTLCGSCISWKSQLQLRVALSTTESEYVAATEAFKEAIWLRVVLSEIGFLDKNMVVFSNSQSAIQLCKNHVFHDRTKHIDVKFHYIQDIVEKCIVKLEKILSELNIVDMSTKCLPVKKFISCQRILNFDLGKDL
ncbi:secreted RxLR effector protein 161-like [Impatiens glandulifera]|uniref:secreted RxLR effector protein 161-like n=1 Tax=Impatiens glandulifera TaxID=253017 RepID=UPI001FB1383A|nr:secreted RxLR effector protein 161-like [Impatiens glandulifera]